jgi:hypothetical protein
MILVPCRDLSLRKGYFITLEIILLSPKNHKKTLERARGKALGKIDL